jgi:hypothetical protein
MEKYLVPARLKARLSKGDVVLLDVCFGLGYNSLAAMELARQGIRYEALGTGEQGSANGGSGAVLSRDDTEVVPPRLQITALEMDRRVVREASRHIQPVTTDSFDWNKTLSDLYLHQSATINHQSSIVMHWGDARHTVTVLEPGRYDLVFLDAFSTQRNSELWTVDFFRKLKRVMKPDAVLLTYCAALPVRSGLMEAGFFVGETDPVGRARGGTIAAMREADIAIPLPDQEISMIRQTTRGLPYRDPHSVWTNKEILRERQERILEWKEELSSNP